MTYNVAGQHPTLSVIAMLERHILFPVSAKTGKVTRKIESYSSKSSLEAGVVQAEVLHVNKELQKMFHKRTCSCRWRSESMNKELGAVRNWLFVRMTKDSGYQGKATSPIYVVPCVAHLAPLHHLPTRNALIQPFILRYIAPNACQSLG